MLKSLLKDMAAQAGVILTYLKGLVYGYYYHLRQGDGWVIIHWCKEQRDAGSAPASSIGFFLPSIP